MRPGRRVAELAAQHPRLFSAWAAVLLAVATAGVATDDRRVWAYLTVAVVLTAVVATASRAASFSTGLLGLLLAVGALHLAGGLVPWSGSVLYDAWLVPSALRFDQAVHVTGSVAATWASWQLAGAYLDLGRTPARAQALIACLGGMGKGAVNEAVEFLLSGTGAGAHVGGYANTGWDLVFDLAGCVAAAVFLVQARCPRVSPDRGSPVGGATGTNTYGASPEGVADAVGPTSVWQTGRRTTTV